MTGKKELFMLITGFVLFIFGNVHEAIITNALYVFSYKQSIFSVQSATSKGATVCFSCDDGHLVFWHNLLCICARKDKARCWGRGVFIGYDKGNPAYLIYYPESRVFS